MADDGGMDEIVTEFLIESTENLDQLDRDLVVLEDEPSNEKVLACIFRTIHTIKGSCGFLGFGKLEAVTHVAESLLSRLRDGELVTTPEIISALLATTDAVREMLQAIESRGNEGDGEYGALIATLRRLQSDTTATAELEPAHIGGERASKPAASTASPGEAADARGHAVDTTIRVDVGLLDTLMNLAGELVLARNQLLQYAAGQNDGGFTAATQSLNLITSELQEGVMRTRMQPVRTVWDKFPRVVRDLAVACHKRARLEMDGGNTELDKTIIEAIKDPLTHLVRNCVDHGLEPPDVRIAAGKSPEGRVLLRAFHEGGRVNIEIADDGGGIDVERVRAKAVERSLVTSEQAARMTERQLLSLIFVPGFSTAEKVSNVSGRGVGMDVVKTNIEKIGGTVDVRSTPGEGTVLEISIPLTLAIVPALVVAGGGERFAVPQVSLLEVVRLEGEPACGGIEMVLGAPVYRLRGSLLPLVYLDEVLELGTAQREAGGSVTIVVLQTGERRFGLVVDGVDDTVEIVVKPLGKQLGGVVTFSGATIMGDGKVVLILDVAGVARRAGVAAASRDETPTDAPEQDGDHSGERQALLLFAVGETGRMAMPLSMVARLEEIPRSAIETAAGRDVVQYRGQIMPLVHLKAAPAVRDPIQVVVVHTHGGRSVGLVVDRILDIVEETVRVTSAGGRAGVRGSAVVQGRVTDLLDPTFFETPGTVELRAEPWRIGDSSRPSSSTASSSG